MITRRTPRSPASLIVRDVTSRCAAPIAPGRRGLPGQFNALIAKPCARSIVRNVLRRSALSSMPPSGRCGADDQLPQPNSSISIPDVGLGRPRMPPAQMQ
jgi:hypothetical protein